MPYIVTTYQEMRETPPFGGEATVTRINESRRAVATLEEARAEAITCMSDDAPGWDESGWTPEGKWLDAFRVAESLPVFGGTISLPDGTVIEVERVSYFEIAKSTPGKHWPGHKDTIIAAYNAAQESS